METSCFNVHQKIKRKLTIWEKLSTDVSEIKPSIEIIFQGKCAKFGEWASPKLILML